jgi:hypothetical protein
MGLGTNSAGSTFLVFMALSSVTQTTKNENEKTTPRKIGQGMTFLNTLFFCAL